MIQYPTLPWRREKFLRNLRRLIALNYTSNAYSFQNNVLCAVKIFTLNAVTTSISCYNISHKKICRYNWHNFIPAQNVILSLYRYLDMNVYNTASFARFEEKIYVYISKHNNIGPTLSNKYWKRNIQLFEKGDNVAINYIGNWCTEILNILVKSDTL